MKFFPILSEFDKEQLALRKKRGATMKQMNEELKKDTVDPAALSPLIATFKQNERDITELRIKRLDALSKVLTEEQVAKMIALVPKFERRIKELIGEARGMQKERRRWSKERDRWSRDRGDGPHGSEHKGMFE